MKRDVKLYNVMFPIWMFLFLPTIVWLIILPVNFAVDSLVVLLMLGRLGLTPRKEIWKQSIIRVWLSLLMPPMSPEPFTMQKQWLQQPKRSEHGY